jgi:hypothetical protein
MGKANFHYYKLQSPFNCRLYPKKKIHQLIAACMHVQYPHVIPAVWWTDKLIALSSNATQQTVIANCRMLHPSAHVQNEKFRQLSSVTGRWIRIIGQTVQNVIRVVWTFLINTTDVSPTVIRQTSVVFKLQMTHSYVEFKPFKGLIFSLTRQNGTINANVGPSDTQTKVLAWAEDIKSTLMATNQF